MLGALSASKGHEYAFKAIRELEARGIRLSLLVAGTGACKARLEDLARRLGVEDQLHMLGWRDDVDRLLVASDALVHATVDTELLPYAIKQAMSRGLPVVATAVGGVPELVEDGVTGLLVPPKDPTALADALARVLHDRHQGDALGAAGLVRIAALFHLDTMRWNVERAYDHALASHGGRVRRRRWRA
jgi:glycosyltransferase involved in cell wall biosynthesis